MTAQKKPRKPRAPNKLGRPCASDFTCIHKGCSVVSENEKQWDRHIRGSTHTEEYAALPAVGPGQAKRKLNKAGLIRPDSGKCQFCDEVFAGQKNWHNHVKSHEEYRELDTKPRPAKMLRSDAATVAGNGDDASWDDDNEGGRAPPGRRRKIVAPRASPSRPNVIIPKEAGTGAPRKKNSVPRMASKDVDPVIDDGGLFVCHFKPCGVLTATRTDWLRHMRSGHKRLYKDLPAKTTNAQLAAAAALSAAKGPNGGAKKKRISDLSGGAQADTSRCCRCSWKNPLKANAATPQDPSPSAIYSRWYNHVTKKCTFAAAYADAPLAADGPKKTYTCNDTTNSDCACGFDTKSKQKWEAHLGERTHVCRNGCGATFTNSGDEGSHAKLHCPSRAQEHVCGIDGCAETSNSLGGIQQHRTGPKHVLPDRKYGCAVAGCKYRHQHLSKVAAHVREVHTDNRPFVCAFVDGDGDSCGKGFKSNGDSTKHGGVHVETYDIPCATCDKLYKTPRLRALHETVVHGEKRFACPEPGCASVFAVKLARDQHTKIHSDIREYACSQCPQTFRQLSVLQNHEMYVHFGTRAHQCAACGLVLTSPSRLATHERVHTDGYVPGSVSVGEQEIFRILQAEFSLSGFRKEATPLGERFRFDFMVDGTFIEYDGLYHYRPGHAAPYKPAALCRFALQVMSDYKKTSFCRKHGAPLLRVTGTLPSDAAFLACLAAATSAPADYSDYVAGHTLTTDLAEHFRVLASQDPLAGEPKPTDVEAEAGELVASVTILGPALLHDEAMDVYQTRIAAFLIFLRENAALSPQEAADAYGAEVMDACIIIARSMPEFNGAPVLRAAAALDLVTLTAAHAAVSVLASPVAVLGPYPVPPTAASVPSAAAPVALRGHGIVRVRDPFIVCWICKIQWANNTRSADLLLRHVNDVHAGGYYVRCATCPTAFHCYDDKTRAGQVGDAAAAHRVQEQHGAHCTRHVEKADHVSKTSRCGHCDSAEVFSTRFRLFRHFNDAHGAGFSHWCTLQCPICLSRNFRTLPNLEGHTCGV